MITIAVSKGRVWDDLQPLLAQAGVAPAPTPQRALLIPAAAAGARFVIVRGQDVPVYVAHGAAACGIVGSDILAEKPNADIYQPLDLGISKCRLALAAKEGFDPRQCGARKITLATKYIRQARAYADRIGMRANFIKIHGAAELAPLVALADAVVDLVQSGETLRANGLCEIETLQEVSAIFIVNRAVSRKNAALNELQQNLAAACAANSTANPAAADAN